MTTIKSRAFGERVDVSELLLLLGGCSSRAEAKRLIKQGAVEIDGDKVDSTAIIWDGSILHVGKRFWRQIELPPKELTFEKQGNQVKILGVEDETR